MGHYLVAERLGMSVTQVGQMSRHEYVHWLAYFQIQNDEQKRLAKKATRK